MFKPKSKRVNDKVEYKHRRLRRKSKMYILGANLG